MTFSTTGGGTIQAPAETRTDGIILVTIRLGPQVGVQQFTASVQGLPPLLFSVIATEAPAAIVQIGEIPTVASVGSRFPWALRIVDAGGNGVPYASVSFGLPAGVTGSGFSSGPTNAQGEVTVIVSFSGTTGLKTIQAQAFGVTQPVQRTIRVHGGEPSQVVKVAGDSQTGVAGRPLPAQVVVAVRDAAGNPVPDVPVSMVVVSGGGSLKATSPLITDASGRIYVTAVSGAAGQQAFQAIVQGLPPVLFAATAVAVRDLLLRAREPELPNSVSEQRRR